MSDPMAPPEAPPDVKHWVSKGKSWKELLDKMGVPHDTTLCGDPGPEARVTGDVTCPTCTELRDGLFTQRQDILAAALAIKRRDGISIREALQRVIIAEGPAPDASPTPDQTTVSAAFMERLTLLVGSLPFYCARFVVRTQTEGKEDVIPPTKADRIAFGNQMLMSTNNAPPWLVAILNHPITQLTMTGVILGLSCERVEVTDGETGEPVAGRRKITRKEIDQLW